MSRAVMEQAREALALCRLNGSQYLYGNERDIVFSALAVLDAALAEQAQPVAECIDDICSEHSGRVEAFDHLPAGTKLYTTPPAPVAPPGWRPISEPYEQADELDIMLSDGSILCAVLPQFDGDLWWGGDGTGEKFIDLKHANVTHWRLHAAPEAPTPPAPQPLTGWELARVIADAGTDELAAVSGTALLRLIRAVEAETARRMGVKQAAESETPNAAGKAHPEGASP